MRLFSATALSLLNCVGGETVCGNCRKEVAIIIFVKALKSKCEINVDLTKRILPNLSNNICVNRMKIIN